jgi:hypothetical protein
MDSVQKTHETTPERPGFKFNYTAFPQQAAFHNDRYEVFARLVSAGTGGGKTYCGLVEAIYWTIECPGSVGMIFEPTYRMLTTIILNQSIPDLMGVPIENSPFVKRFQRTEGRVDWKNGSRWYMMGLDEPERAEGPSIDWIWADEFRLVGGSGAVAQKKQETAWQVFLRRLRGSPTGRARGWPRGIWITTTPDYPGSVLYKRFEDPRERMGGAKIYRWGVDANIHLPEEWRQAIKASHVEGTGLYERFINGIFAQVGAGVYAFDSTIHLTENIPVKRFHFKRMIYGVDFGWSQASAIIAIWVDRDNRAYIVDEFYQSRCSIERLCDEALAMKVKWGHGRFYCDPAEPRSIDALRAAGLPVEKNAIKRDAGIHEMGGRFKVEPDGRPRIYVHPRCVNWIQEVQSYDSAIKENDHAMDATRYALGNLRVANPAWILG